MPLLSAGLSSTTCNSNCRKKSVESRGGVVLCFFYKLEFFKKYLSCCSVTQLCLTLCTPQTAASQASLSFTTSHILLILMSIESVKPSNLLILYCPLLLLPSIFPSIRVFYNELALYSRWPKCWSFSFSISPSNEYSGLTSFRID